MKKGNIRQLLYMQFMVSGIKSLGEKIAGKGEVSYDDGDYDEEEEEQDVNSIHQELTFTIFFLIYLFFLVLFCKRLFL